MSPDLPMPGPAGTSRAASSGEWPPLSVVVPTHGRPELLRGTVRAILEQDYPGDIECLVVFDREDPHRPDVTVPDRRELRLLVNDRTPGPAGAYNVGAINARGELFALCDDDDEWLPEKARLQVAALRRRPEAAFATCGVYLGDASATRNPTRVPEREILTLDYLLETPRNALHSSTFMVWRSRIFEDIGLVDEDIPYSYGEDYDWLLRAASVAPVVAVRRPLVWVRWRYSYYTERWPAIIEGLAYQIEHRPEFHRNRKNLSRIYGRMAFAHAALGNSTDARALARRSIRLDPLQLRGYLSFLVSLRIVKPEAVMRALHATGRGM